MVTETEVRDWLAEFAECVRNQDYERGRQLFAPRVYSFGTVAEAASGLDQLVATQWRQVWGRTRDFTIDLDSAVIEPGASDSLSYALISWRSFKAEADSEVSERIGRATLIFQAAPCAPHGIQACHSHFSKTPPGGFVNGPVIGTPEDLPASRYFPRLSGQSWRG